VEQVLSGGGGGEVTQIMCTHISKCKNEKIKLKEKIHEEKEYGNINPR
jgi:hypothetical protein